MKVSDIISRVLYEVDDEQFIYLKPQELIVTLDRVYNYFCRRTKAYTKEVAFYTEAGIPDYALDGVDENGVVIGPDMFRFNRVTINGVRAEERDIESILLMRENASWDATCTPPVYAVAYSSGIKVLSLPYNPDAGIVIALDYVCVPPIGTLTSLDQTIGLEELYSNYLVEGVSAKAHDRVAKVRLRNPSNADFSLAKYHFEKAKELTVVFETKVLELSRDVQSFMENSTTLVAGIGTPFYDENDDFNDINYAGV